MDWNDESDDTPSSFSESENEAEASFEPDQEASKSSFKDRLKGLFLLGLSLGSFLAFCIGAYVFYIYQTLPSLDPILNYNPQRVSVLYDRDKKPVDSFFKERRELRPLEEIPNFVRQAFIASEDNSFYEHSGIQYISIARALIANLKAGRKAQGASTITQQVAKIFLLTYEKTYTRKLKEFFLAKKIENLLEKDEILFLYLNQIYLGNGAYGVAKAAEVYFKKDISDISIAEAALLAGLPQAPSKYSPSKNPSAAKARQSYVLRQMKGLNFISEQDFETALNTPITIYNYRPEQAQAPYFKSLVSQVIEDLLGSAEAVFTEGLKIYTTLDLEGQLSAEKEVKKGLRATDKRQGFRGVLKNVSDPEKVEEFALESYKKLKRKKQDKFLMLPSGEFPEGEPFEKITPEPLFSLPSYLPKNLITRGIVTKVDDQWGLTTVQIAGYTGLIDIQSMNWARKPNPPVFYTLDRIKKPSAALKVGDVILVKIIKAGFESKRLAKAGTDLSEDYADLRTYITLELEQEPLVQGGLLSLSNTSDEVLALVGGYDFKKSQFNRVLQAKRQAGSTFKIMVYMAALGYGLLPNTKILDAPLVFDKDKDTEDKDEEIEELVDSQDLPKDEENPEKQAKSFDYLWKPQNSSEKFSGELLLRTALIKSKNIPTIKLTQKMGVNWIANYARRMGVVNKLNQDLTLGLGSSGTTLYEMTKVFAQIARIGKRSQPIFIRSIEDHAGNVLTTDISLDYFIQDQIDKNEVKIEILRQAHQAYELAKLEDDISVPTKVSVIHPETQEEITIKTRNIPKFFFEDPNQLISPQSAAVLLSMLKGVISKQGTGRAAMSIRRPAFGKTGTTNGYYDAWFIGATSDITTGVWVGFDEEKTLGRGEFGSRTALPIWLGHMKRAHRGLPKKDFPAPSGVVSTNIDSDTGLLPSTESKNIFEQVFIEGTEPNESLEKESNEQEDFLKEGF